MTTRGGKRPGAGRKPAEDGPLSRHMVTINPLHVKFLKKRGTGKLSPGIADVTDEAMKQEKANRKKRK